MANRERGEIGVEVEGKPYTLRPSFDAICEFESLTGKTIEVLFEDIESGRLSGLRAVVWCLLQAEHADEIRVLKDASEWVERAGGIDVVTVHLAQLRELNTEPSKNGKAANPRKAQAGIGRRSSKARGTSV